MELYSNENLIYECSATNLISSFSVQQGTIYVTSKRLVFCKRPWYALPLFGPVFMHLFKGSVEVFEIPLRKLNGVADEKHGFATKCVIYYASNKKEQIQVVDIDLLKNKIVDAIRLALPEGTINQLENRIEFSIN